MTVKEEYTLAIATSLISKFEVLNSDPMNWMESIDWDIFFKKVEQIAAVLLHNTTKNNFTIEQLNISENRFLDSIEDYLKEAQKRIELHKKSKLQIHLDDNTNILVDKDGCIRTV